MGINNRYKLAQEDFQDFLMFKGKTIMDRILNSINKVIGNSSVVKYSILIPSSDYWRGELFCEDMQVLSDGYNFTQADLLDILFQDFLINVRLLSNPIGIYNYLKSIDSRPPIIRYNGEEVIMDLPRAQTMEIECYINRKDAVRAEVFLSDLAELFPDDPLSVQDILQIRYCYFIKEYKMGNMKEVIPSIMKHLNIEFNTKNEIF